MHTNWVNKIKGSWIGRKINTRNDRGLLGILESTVLCMVPIFALMVYSRHLQQLSGASSTQKKDAETSAPQNENNEKELSNSVKPYKRHCIVSGGGEKPELWPIHVDDDAESTFVAKMSSSVAKKAKELKGTQLPMLQSQDLKITLCDDENSRPDSVFTDVIIYPDNLRYMVSMALLEKFSELVLFAGPTTQHPYHTMFSSVEPSWKALILVCAHAKRDARCGRAGLQVIEKMKKELASVAAKYGDANKTIAVRASSHIGGHEFAGTLIVYPQADWYGKVKATDNSVGRIVAAVSKYCSSESGQGLNYVCNGVNDQCHRGRADLAW